MAIYEQVFPTDDQNYYVDTHKDLNVGQIIKVFDDQIIDPIINLHATIPCQVIYKEYDQTYGKVFYYLIAIGEDNEFLNSLCDNKFPQKYYKILESTSPYIIID